MKHTPEDERFFNAVDVFEVVKNEYGQLELYPVGDSIRPIAREGSKHKYQDDYSYCQIVGGRIIKAFRKEEIAFVPRKKGSDKCMHDGETRKVQQGFFSYSECCKCGSRV